MSASLSSIRVPPDALPAVNAQLSYFASGDNPAEVRVYPPGSAHRPTVAQGRALVLYLLPEGQISFTK